MPHRIPLVLALALSASLVTTAARARPRLPEPGISLELARERRANLSDVRYALSFDLRPGAAHVEGEVVLDFVARDPKRGAVVDFGGEDLWDVTLNGAPVDPHGARVADHVVLPRRALRSGSNRFVARFRSSVAAAGAPLTAFRDPASDSIYFYTLLVPADAHRLFPCFDQPDLKGRFSLDLTAPPDWRLVANGAALTAPHVLDDGRVRQRFEETPPLSTYLFAFAGGPFAVVEAPAVPGTPPLRVFVRPAKLGASDTAHLIELHRAALAWLERYFDVPYPFAKLDCVLVPSFPYGGMEHAGAIFYREDSLVFDHRPTDLETANRSTLVYHELTHQWFGNLVTMAWFDDLWLKEGFANLMAYELLDQLEPERHAWVRFHQRVKQRAYRVDATDGTTPIWQSLANLADAKSAYGEIVYDKAPAVLRELSVRLGEQVFRDGLQRFLKRYAWSNARWRDLIDAWTAAGARDLDGWSKRWVLEAGMPSVRATWTTDDQGRIRRIELNQRRASTPLGAPQRARPWPLDLSALLATTSGESRTIRLRTDRAQLELDALVGSEAPAWVLLNPGDTAYGRFLLDSRSADALLAALPTIRDPLARTLAFSALWETTGEAEIDPRRFGRAALALLAAERFPGSRAQAVAALASTIERYLDGPEAAALRRDTVAMLVRQLEAGELAGLELDTFRAIVRLARDPEHLAWVAQVLDGERVVDGLGLGTRDRFEALAPLLASGDPGAAARLVRLRDERAAEDGAWYAYAVGAAAADADTKRRYFESYSNPSEPPEAWAEDSLDFFHWPGEEALTAPYLEKALNQLAWVKQHRKIFFLPAWIDAFVNGQSSPQALAEVEAFLASQPRLDLDVRRKVLQSLDALRRAVKVRSRTWPAEPAPRSTTSPAREPAAGV